MADPEATLRCLFKFVGVRGFDPADISARSSFNAMRAVELKGAGKHLGLHGIRGNDPESLKVRRGVIGGYRELLSNKTTVEAKALLSAFGFTGSGCIDLAGSLSLHPPELEPPPKPSSWPARRHRLL
jgi:hypothetical protein